MRLYMNKKKGLEFSDVPKTGILIHLLDKQALGIGVGKCCINQIILTLNHKVSKLNNFIIKSVRKWVSDQVPKPEGLSLMLVSSIEQIKGHRLGLYTRIYSWFIQFVKRISQAQAGSGFGL